MNLTKISAAALAALALSSGAAFAQDVMVVRFGGLDLKSDEGAQIALRRIKTAASKFCGEAGAREVRRAQAQKACVARMTQTAVDGLDAPYVTALHGSQSKIVLARRTN